ncbi:MAG: hypothetical protein V3V20_10920, partial [Algisphaera sp.]
MKSSPPNVAPHAVTYAVAALYRFVRIADPPALRETLQATMDNHDLCGTLLVAPEGLNGTIAGEPESLRTFIQNLRSQHEGLFADLDVKWSTAQERPFRRTRVRLKKEIVTLGVADLDATDVGTYVDPQDWNALI